MFLFLCSQAVLSPSLKTRRSGADTSWATCCWQVLQTRVSSNKSLLQDDRRRFLKELCRDGNSNKCLCWDSQGLKAVDGSIKKESDLPAADPNTPIPLKYEDGASAAEKGISLLLERGQSTFSASCHASLNQSGHSWFWCMFLLKQRGLCRQTRSTRRAQGWSPAPGSTTWRCSCSSKLPRPTMSCPTRPLTCWSTAEPCATSSYPCSAMVRPSCLASLC